GPATNRRASGCSDESTRGRPFPQKRVVAATVNVNDKMAPCDAQAPKTAWFFPAACWSAPEFDGRTNAAGQERFRLRVDRSEWVRSRRAIPRTTARISSIKIDGA